MKKKLKLAFAQLDKELMTIGAVDELKAIKGGFTTDDVINYFSNLGFEFTQGSGGSYSAWGPASGSGNFEEGSGNYWTWGQGGWAWHGEGSGNVDAPHYGGTLSGVTIVGSGSSGSGDGGPGDSGWYSGENSSGWDFESMDGAYDFSYFMDMYSAMTGTPTYEYTPPPSEGPFSRDSNGHIIAVPTGNTFIYDGYLASTGVQLNMQEVTLQTSTGPVTAYKVTGALNANGNPVTLLDSYKANCFGLATADGEYWFMDNPNTTANEWNGFDSMITSQYDVCTFNDATLAVVYTSTGTPFPYHAGIVNPDGSFTAKSAMGGETLYANAADFRGGYVPGGPDGLYTNGTLVYYKLKGS